MMREMGTIRTLLADPGRAVRAFLWAQLAWFVVPALLFLFPEDTPGGRISQAVGALSLSHGAWMAASWVALGGGLFDLYPLFGLASHAFHTGQQIVMLLQIAGLPEAPNLIAEGHVSTQLLVFLCHVTLHAGALAGLGFEARRRCTAGAPDGLPHTSRFDRVDLEQAGKFLIALGVIPLCLYLLRAGSVADHAGYQAIYKEGEQLGQPVWSAYLSLGRLALCGALLLLGASSERPGRRRMLALVISVTAAAFLFIGTRNLAVTALVSALWLWDRTIHRLPRALVASVGLVLLLIVCPLVLGSRNDTHRSVLSPGYWLEKLRSAGNPARVILTNMGFTEQVVHMTRTLVPERRPFARGATYLRAAGRAAFLPVHSGLDTESSMLTSWLIWHVDPAWAREGGDYGFSYLAEAYLNFGWIGAQLISLLLGLVLALTDRRHGAHPLGAPLIACALPALLYGVRTEAAVTLPELVRYVLFPLLVCSLARRRR